MGACWRGGSAPVAVDVVVGGGLGLVCDEAGDDCNGQDVEVEEEVVNQHGPASRCGHGIVAWDSAAECQCWTANKFEERT